MYCQHRRQKHFTHLSFFIKAFLNEHYFQADLLSSIFITQKYLKNSGGAYRQQIIKFLTTSDIMFIRHNLQGEELYLL